MCEVTYPLFPNIWKLAASQDMCEFVLQGIMANAHERRSNGDTKSNGSFISAIELGHLVLSELEPLILQDDKVMDLLARVPWSLPEMKQLLCDTGIYTNCSTRAICLLNRIILSLHTPRNEYRFSVKLSLFAIQPGSESTRHFLFPLEETVGYNDSYYGYNVRTEIQNVTQQWSNAIVYTLKVRKDQSGLEFKVSWALNQKSIRLRLPIIEYNTAVEIISDGCVCLSTQSPKQTNTTEKLLRKESSLIDSSGSMSIKFDESDIISYKSAHNQACSLRISLIVWEHARTNL